MTEITNKQDKVQKLRVFRHKSTFKGATENDFWYSATRSDGASVMCKFKCPVLSESNAFEISNIVGTFSHKVREVKDVLYDNFTYYINSCDFSEIEGEELPI